MLFWLAKKAAPDALINLYYKISFKTLQNANVLHVPLHDFQQKISATDLDKKSYFLVSES